LSVRPGSLGGLARTALIAGLAGLAVSALLGVARPGAFFFGYLCAFVLWFGVPLGCAAILMTHHLVNGRWGWSVRGPAEAALRTLPLVALLFVPVLFGLSRLYAWARPAAVAASPELTAKAGYLNEPFFLARAALFFLLWIVGGLLLLRGSRAHRRAGGGWAPLRLARLAGAGLVVWGLTVTFAGIDWVGSLAATWYSTIFGLYILVGQALTALALVVVLITTLPRPDGTEPVPATVLHDLGNLMLMLVILHAYMGYSQFFIIWNGNKPEEIQWYLPRLHGLWGGVAVVLLVIHFFLPFFALLSRRVKRNAHLLRRVAVIVLAARVADAAWMVLPAFGGSRLHVAAAAMAAMVGVGGLWLAVFAWSWRRDVTADLVAEGVSR
jgi:hypothetical protein